MVTQKLLRTRDGKQVFLQNNFGFATCCRRSKQMPKTNQITDFPAPHVRTHFWATSRCRCHGADRRTSFDVITVIYPLPAAHHKYSKQNQHKLYKRQNIKNIFTVLLYSDIFLGLNPYNQSLDTLCECQIWQMLYPQKLNICNKYKNLFFILILPGWNPT
mgnify:CR=1 FL=1